ncbi:hypothetical protein AQS70_09685 [Pseudomonas endophytica]|uniref:EstP n=1 Tax=Pseudomonas endophytica TaxID=1563157 RepID=A0A0Q0T1P8_9PSED|nr:hypothetical protein [Pseudomonas endophytica]KQB53706.1 hypothetical protein AQS70_09685 [Pseudomonas endophytica]
MSLQIEVRYLMINWQSEGVARDIKAAPHALEIERDASGELSVESTVFNDFHPWLGIRLESALDNTIPVFVSASGEETPMLRIADQQGCGQWWLQHDGWDPLNKRHFSELHRSAGAYFIRLGNLRLRIENRLSSFGRADIQAYINDFRGDLLWMIMNDAAAATASGQGPGSGAELAVALKALNAASNRVLASPAVDIREGQAPQSIAKLRPNAATFHEYLRNPAARYFTGRVFNESADIPENRYVRHMLAVALKVAAAYMSAATLQTDFLRRLTSQEAERASRDSAIKSRAVDPEVFDHQTQDIARRLEALTCFTGPSTEYPDQIARFPIRLGKRYGDKCAFFYERQDGQQASGDAEIDYRVVVLPEDVFELILAAHHFCKDLTLAGCAQTSVKITSSGKRYRELKFISVHGIWAQTHALENRAAKRKYLEVKDWQVALSTNELRELKREAAIAQRRAKRSSEKRIAIASSIQEIAREAGLLQATDASLAKFGVAPSSSFPLGMRLVSNPDYSACVSAFNKIRQLINRGGLDLSKLDEINNIGILHASEIYEKWCLIKILTLLIHDFRFEPEIGWEEKLITSTLARSNNVRFECLRHDLKISASLTCQAEMLSGRRPDFVLDITHTEDEQSTRYNPPKGRRIGLVMDAKFRSKWRKGELTQMLDELILIKGYDQALENAKVFILQPCGLTVRPAKSPLEWGAHSDYSRTNAHRQGWIQAGVTSSGAQSTQHLKRLLALAFQSSFPAPRQLSSDQDDTIWESRSFCIGCGERHDNQSIKAKRTKSGAMRWLLDCRHCGVWTTRTHCYSCPTPLFKNGTVWTYHTTIADQVTNVICPSCGAYFDKDFE